MGINAVVGNNGFINEVCRDTTHPQYTLQVWMQAAEIAWKHGIDLYGMTINSNATPQFAINLENFSRLFLGQIPPPCDATFLTNYNYLGDQSVSGAYDIAHNHYVNRLALPGLTNYADMVVNHWRPGGFDGHFCAWSTLTHADLSTGVPVVTNLSLWQNSSNAPVRSLGDGETLNLRALGGNYALAAQVAGTVSSVRFLTNSTSAAALDTAAPFLTAFPPVGNYFLSAIPQRTFPAGTISGDPFLRFLRVIDLPGMWMLLDVGAPAIPALAQELTARSCLTAAGTNLTGTSDQFGFLATDISGDMQITAQVGAQSATNGRAGIMLREGTSVGARFAFLSLGPSTTNGLSFQYRAQSQVVPMVSNAAAPSGVTWLRLTRFGDTVSAYSSADGKAWAMSGSATVTLGASIRAGLAAFSGNPGNPTAVSFQSVLVEPLAANYAEWTMWLLARQGVTNALLTAHDADPDGDRRSNQLEYWLGSNPLLADLEPTAQAADLVPGQTLRVRFAERKNAAALGREFESSASLSNWLAATPLSITTIEDRGSVVVREVTLPAPTDRRFYRSRYPALPP